MQVLAALPVGEPSRHAVAREPDELADREHVDAEDAVESGGCQLRPVGAEGNGREPVARAFERQGLSSGRDVLDPGHVVVSRRREEPTIRAEGEFTDVADIGEPHDPIAGRPIPDRHPVEARGGDPRPVPTEGHG